MSNKLPNLAFHGGNTTTKCASEKGEGRGANLPNYLHIDPSTMSGIRVFVTFPESNAVFAGETLQCKITFKNVSQKPGTKVVSPSQHGSPTTSNNGYLLEGSPNIRTPKPPPLHIPSVDVQGALSPRLPWARPPSAGHKPSFSQPALTTKSPPLQIPSITTSPNGRPPNHKHKRSVSIVSLSSEIGLESGGRGTRDGGIRSPPTSASRPKGHGRSASLQIASGRQAAVPNGVVSNPSMTLPFPHLESKTELR